MSKTFWVIWEDKSCKGNKGEFYKAKDSDFREDKAIFFLYEQSILQKHKVNSIPVNEKFIVQSFFCENSRALVLSNKAPFAIKIWCNNKVTSDQHWLPPGGIKVDLWQNSMSYDFTHLFLWIVVVVQWQRKGFFRSCHECGSGKYAPQIQLSIIQFWKPPHKRTCQRISLPLGTCSHWAIKG